MHKYCCPDIRFTVILLAFLLTSAGCLRSPTEAEYEVESVQEFGERKPREGIEEVRGSVYSLSFTPDSKVLATFSLEDEDYIRFWNVQKKTLENSLWVPGRAWPRKLAFSKDGLSLVVDGADQVELWDVTTHRHRASLKHKGVCSVAFSPDGGMIVSGDQEGEIKIWDAATGQERATFARHHGTVWAIAFAPDGDTFATASADGTVELWDAVSGDHRSTLKHAGAVFDVAFSPDGTRIASAVEDASHTLKTGEAILWDANSGEALVAFEGFKFAVWRVAFSMDGKLLATGSEDHTLRVFDIPSRTLVRSKRFPYPVMGLSFSPDGKFLAVGGGELPENFADSAEGWVEILPLPSAQR